MKKTFLAFLLLSIFIAAQGFSDAQKVEVVNGVRIIHNEKKGAWGETPAVQLELIRTLGGDKPKDPNLAFGAPYDVVADSQGNIYVLDQRNTRIQKLSPEGSFLLSIGGHGQGPGDFQAPFSMDIDGVDRLYVSDYVNRRIQVMTSEGKPESAIILSSTVMVRVRLLKSGEIITGGGGMAHLREMLQSRKKLPPLLTLINAKGKTQKSFGEMKNYSNANVNAHANEISFDIDREDNVCVSFRYQNRIEKFSSDGSLLWRADRVLHYGTEVIDKGYVHQDYKGIRIQAPSLNTVSTGIAADGKGRLWSVTLNRQMTREEMGEEVVAGGRRKVIEPIIHKMDIYKLEVFGPDGILLGEFPLNHVAHGIRIFDQHLFLWEFNTSSVYQYRIHEN